jgi:ethanolamine utilization protein EutQ (cupin superfamily)
MLGVYVLSGDLEGELTLNLTISGTTMAGAMAGDVVRVPGTTTITGTATNSDGGVYNINITI